MQTHREKRRDNGVEYPSADAKRAASDFFEQVLQRTARSDFADCWALAKSYDDFRQQSGPTATTTNIAADPPAIRDVLHAPITPGTQQVSVPVYTTDAPYPASNAEVQIYRHGLDDAAPCAVHLVTTTRHFTEQQGAKWVTELLRNWRPLNGKSFTVQDLEFLDFIDHHRHTPDTAHLWQQWNHDHPERTYNYDNFRNHLKRLLKRLRSSGVLVEMEFEHIPVILSQQEDGMYTASVVVGGPRVSAATAEAALIAVLHIERASSEEAGPEEYRGRNA